MTAHRDRFDNLGTGLNMINMYLAQNVRMSLDSRSTPGDAIHWHASALQFGSCGSIEENYFVILKSFAQGCHSLRTYEIFGCSHRSLVN